ncbi:MAG TPA: translation initiation factor IF-2, partial [Clostridia bacterium]|nr:translation initiation factor IF-2 [Clostridia bacterium]
MKTEASKPVISVKERMTVQELAKRFDKQGTELIKDLMGLGIMASLTQEIDFDAMDVLAKKYGYELDLEQSFEEENLDVTEEEDDPQNLKPRACVVTVMGHVDHGKTSLLDAIRKTNVTAKEAGGITQHIGAYQVNVNGKKIVFLDTPGHEAFTAMRARGAQVTDIAVLVVAADDGVMPQTVEAINHAKAAKVPIIVAINKIDKPTANPERVKQELTEYGLIPEEWGGDTICVPVSATQKTGLDNLLEMILLVAEMLELKANPQKPAKGVVIEAKLDKGRGPVATVLVQEGTLKVGDPIVAGHISGKVRAMNNDKGQQIKEAGPSTPVEVLGLTDVPQAGDVLQVFKDEKIARQIAEKRKLEKRNAELQRKPKVSLDDLFKQIQAGEVKELNIIIKADVQGSAEALRQSVEQLTTNEVKVNVIHSGVGGISENDVLLASASNAIIIGFNVRPDNNARNFAKKENVDIRTYRIIYEVIDDIKKAIIGLLEPEYREVVIGRAEVREIFKVSKVGTIAGCYVLDGKVTRNAKIRVIRDNKVIYEGRLESLKRFKDDVKEVLSGFECGMNIERFNDLKEGDIIEAYVEEVVARQK